VQAEITNINRRLSVPTVDRLLPICGADVTFLGCEENRPMLKLVFVLLTVVGLPLFLSGFDFHAQTRTRPTTAVAGETKAQPIPYTERFSFSKCVADNGYIYWLRGDDQLLRVNRDDSKYPESLVETNTRIGNFAVDGNNLYYMSENKVEHGGADLSFKLTGEVRKVDLSSGNISTLLNGFKWPDLAFIGTDSTHIYFLEGGNSVEKGLVLMRLAKNGGEPDPITSGLKAPNGFVVDGKNIYWSDYADNSVRKVAKTGGEQTVLFDGNEYQTAPATVTSDDQYLYLLGQAGKIYQIDKEGGKWKMLYTYKGNFFDGRVLVSADNFLYWPVGNRIMRLSEKGGNPTLVSLLQSESRCVAADDKYIYWDEQQKGLMKTPK
jgi:hypothetical protein